MKNLFKDQQILAIIIGGVAATMIALDDAGSPRLEYLDFRRD